ncbi:MAG: CusA/CzcA family heavy metal efflux RND transporter, partial [Sphingobacteriales bacterium]
VGELREGPAQISREDAKRRVVIGFNVRGRDVQSVVREIQMKLAEFPLPTGYYFTYGGTFENLQQASARLKIAVPIALLLIFTLLYFTFGSLKQATLIFTAIPMSAIGGIFALLVRGMPFSISAGVGFIALFGVAVLNGIVLIGTFNQLKKDGMNDILERIRVGTRIRLRPVLMTATVASLGFLPMAISNGAGAEVQKPLATVVIGGLVTATILTLIVLPLLYLMFNSERGRGSRFAPFILLFVLLVAPFCANSQTQPGNEVRLSLAEAYEIALRNNLLLRSSDLALQRSQVLTTTFLDLPKTGIFAENEDLRPSDRQGILKIGVSQSLEYPGIYRARRHQLQEQVTSFSYSRSLKALELRRNLEVLYYTLWYHQSKYTLWQELDSFYHASAYIARLRAKTGESAGLDSISANAKSMETHVQLTTIANDIRMQQVALKALLNNDTAYLPQSLSLGKVVTQYPPSTGPHPSLLIQAQAIRIAEADVRLARMSQLPEFSGRLFSQRLYGKPDPYSGFSVTVGVPLLSLRTHRNRVKAAQLEQDYQSTLYTYEGIMLRAQIEQTEQELAKSRSVLEYYETVGFRQAQEITRAANLAYTGGEISFAELSQYLTQAIDIRKNYLEALHKYNLAAIQLNYYQNR